MDLIGADVEELSSFEDAYTQTVQPDILADQRRCAPDLVIKVLGDAFGGRSVQWTDR